MGSEDFSTMKASAARWFFAEDRICLKTEEFLIFLSAADIVRSEHKGKRDFEGLTVSGKPSAFIDNLKISRFPAELKLVLKMPSDRLRSPVLVAVASSGGQILETAAMPGCDQLIANNIWFPLIPDNLTDIDTLLRDCEIEQLGVIRLKQALKLLTSDSEYLVINESENSEQSESTELTSEVKDSELARVGITAALYPYQKTGVSWLESIAREGLGCILADEMGLGKTLQVIAILTLHAEKSGLPSLVISPATLLENWRREFCKFSGNLNVHIHSGPGRTGFPSKLKQYDIVITSYDVAVRDEGMFGIVGWNFVVIDEAQAIKNPDTQRATAVKSLKRNVSLAVTGTPVENRLMDLWSVMDFSCPGLLGTRAQFESIFSDSEAGANKLERIVSPLMLRRLVVDVAKDLPEKIIIPQFVNMSEEEIEGYEDLRHEIIEEYGKSATLVSLIKLRQYCSHPLLLRAFSDDNPAMISDKYLRLTEILEEIVGQRQKAIIFTSFTKMSDLLARDLPKRFGIQCNQIDGRTEVTERQNVVDRFSEISGAALLILNPKAAGTGLNITAANHVIHYDLVWNPAVEDQATARSYRRGQQLPVTVHRLFYAGSVEEVMNDRIERKRALAEIAVVGTDGVETDSADIARALTISPASANFR